MWKALKIPAIPPFSGSVEIHAECVPWWGGFWEQLVRNIKSVLMWTLGGNSFRGELTTVLHGIGDSHELPAPDASKRYS